MGFWLKVNYALDLDDISCATSHYCCPNSTQDALHHGGFLHSIRKIISWPVSPSLSIFHSIIKSRKAQIFYCFVLLISPEEFISFYPQLVIAVSDDRATTFTKMVKKLMIHL